MIFHKRTFLLIPVLICLFLSASYAGTFDDFSSTSKEGELKISYKLPANIIEKIKAVKDKSKWKDLLGLTCRENTDGACIPEISTIVELPDSIERALKDGSAVKSAVGYLAGESTPIPCDENTFLGVNGRLREEFIAAIHFRPLLLSPKGKTDGCFERIDFKITWNVPKAKTKRKAASKTPDPFFEKLYSGSVLNYGAFEDSARKAKSPKREFLDFASINPSFKLYVIENGIYRLTYTDLESAGFPLSSVTPATIKIIFKNQEVPIYVSGEGDGKFDSGDYIEFYGEKETESFYTEYNTYWLTYGGSNGLRMQESDGTAVGNKVTVKVYNYVTRKEEDVERTVEKPTYYESTLHFEKDNFFLQATPNIDGKDYWFEKGYGTSFEGTGGLDKERIVELPFLATGVAYNALVRASLHGTSDDPGVFPDHHDKLTVNGVDGFDNSGDFWEGRFPHIIKRYVPSSDLVPGNNTIKLSTIKDTGASIDNKFINWYEVTYPREFEAEGDIIDFTGLASRPVDYELKGFTSSNVRVFEITGTYEARLVTVPASQIVDVGGSYNVTFRRIENRTKRNYIVLTSPKAPLIIQHVQNDLRDTANEADYIIITRSRFIDTLTKPITSDYPSLVEHRKSQGYRVKVVDVADVYEEFSYGVQTPDAIKRFLEYAYDNWTAPAPAFVLFVGDANIDYFANYPGRIIGSPIPTMIVKTEVLGYAPSDNPFACVSGQDSIPDIFLGRISARSINQVKNAVLKILSYETGQNQAWHKNALLISAAEQRFIDVNDEVASLIPQAFNVKRLSPRNPSEINREIDAGALITNYVGHGAVRIWGNNGDPFYNDSDINSLTNGDKLTFIVALNCLNGYVGGFVSSDNVDSFGTNWKKDDPCLAESFMNTADKGAVAMFTATSVGFTEEHLIIDKKLMEVIFKRGDYVIGSAITTAKILGAGSLRQETIDSFILIGDPATKLKAPVPVAPTSSSSVSAGNDSIILSSGIFNDGFGSTHASSTWQVTETSGDYSNTVVDSDQDTKNLTSLTVSYANLKRGATYYWRVIHYGQAGGSTPSAELSFTVTHDIDKDGYDVDLGSDDCNDGNPAIYPGAPEIKDRLDNDCDGIADDGFEYRNTDIDGDGYYSRVDDCNDNDKNINPGAVEIQDGIDNNCDGVADEGFTRADTDVDKDGYLVGVDCDDNNADINPGAVEVKDRLDNDCDGIGDEGFFVNTDLDKDGYFSRIDDCDDNNSAIHPGALEILDDGIDNDCDGVEGKKVDYDGDGYSVGENDCNDLDPNINPDAVEIKDKLDNNCDGVADEGLAGINVDLDNDGYFAGVDDCNDNDANIHPRLSETQDGIDNNCDGVADEGLGDTTTDSDNDGYFVGVDDCNDNDPNINPLGFEVEDGIDNDCSGVADEIIDSDKDGYYAKIDDCDDNDPNIHPGTLEIEDRLDNNCDGIADEKIDLDGDGYSPTENDCNDVDPNIYPGAPERNNRVDDNCDGVADEGFMYTIRDFDGDGYLVGIDDCDDNNPNIYPMAPEARDRIDNDCDGIADNGSIYVNFGYKKVDSDNDGYFTGVNDCNDRDASIYLGAAEIDDGIDNDCDGVADEKSDLDGDGYFAGVDDCDDNNKNINPNAREIEDGIDNNCDGIADEGSDKDKDGYFAGVDDCNDNDPNVHSAAVEKNDRIDNDCDGIADEKDDFDGDGYIVGLDDCDDTDANIHPKATEIKDGIDNNCDGVTDEGFEYGNTDSDTDSYFVGGHDCDDVNANVNPGATEVLDGIDNNCDGRIDEGLVDKDKDGHSPYSAGGEDCDDNDPTTYPGAPEIQDINGGDGIDHNCDGKIFGSSAPVPTVTEWGIILLAGMFVLSYWKKTRVNV